MLLPPPKNADAAALFRLFLSQSIVRSIGRPLPGDDAELFVRAIGSYDWVRLHRAIVLVEPGVARTEAEHALIASILVDADGRRAFDVQDLDGLYASERDRLVRLASDTLVEVSPTFASHDIDKWIELLSEGAVAPENLADAFSLGQCRVVSWGFGKGMVAVRHEPEAYFGIPRRDLIDAQWLAYYAAVGVYMRANR